MIRLCFNVLLLNCSLAFGQDSTKHTVNFEFDVFQISSNQKQSLRNWLSGFSADSVTKIQVVGYADYLGSDKYNITLSENRANSVISFIEAVNTFRYRTSLVSAVGEEFSKPRSDAAGSPRDRKVEVVLTRFTKKLAIVPTPPTKEKPKPYTESDLLVKAEVGQTIVLKNLNFFPGRHYLIPAAMPELERLISILGENPTMEIEIQGHICCKLDSIDGLDINTRTYSLSANRAEYISDQLVLAGINQHRIKHSGFAGLRPLIRVELTELDRQRNRRVEIKILKK